MEARWGLPTHMCNRYTCQGTWYWLESQRMWITSRKKSGKNGRSVAEDDCLQPEQVWYDCQSPTICPWKGLHQEHALRRTVWQQRNSLLDLHALSSGMWSFQSRSPQTNPCLNVKRYLINHLSSTRIIGGQGVVFLFRRLTAQPHQGNMNNPTSTLRR